MTMQEKVVQLFVADISCYKGASVRLYVNCKEFVEIMMAKHGKILR
jgi:hypothetical protein